jgi:hypothetical protein
VDTEPDRFRPCLQFHCSPDSGSEKKCAKYLEVKGFLLPYASHVSDRFDSPTVPFLSRPEELNIDYPKKNSACFLKMFIRND